MSIFDEEKLAEAYNKGLAAEKAGDYKQAEAAYREALSLDPDDHGGVAIRLASLGLATSPEKAPDAYVATLFDQHAEVFDQILVSDLGYRVPEMIAAELSKIQKTNFDRLLDLGCGTGLAGAALETMATYIVGADISEKMVEMTYERGIYDELFIGEAVEFLMAAEEDAPFDIIIAADVAPYIGALEPLVEQMAARLTSKGVIAFSTETNDDSFFEEEGYKVGAHQRFAHSQAYVTSLLVKNGFSVLTLKPITVRHEQGAPVPGHLVIAELV